jgi:hypothetical protein
LYTYKKEEIMEAQNVDLEGGFDDGGVPPQNEQEQTRGEESAASEQALKDSLGGEEKPSEDKHDEEGSPAEGKKFDVQIDIDSFARGVFTEYGINQFITGKYDIDALDKLMTNMYPDEDSQKKALDDPTSFLSIFINCIRNGWGSNALPSYLQCLSDKDKNGKTMDASFVSQSDKTIGSFADIVSHDVKKAKGSLTGNEARKAFMGRLNGYRRVKLLNSGFWIALRRPLIHELQDIFDIIDMQQKEIGYSIGAHFALCADMYVKKIFLETLIKFRIIVDSNLEGIYEDGVLVSALSFLDYESIIQSLLSLMSRKGLRARVVCPECKLVTVLDGIDISSAKFVNRNLITDAVREWWSAKTTPDGKPLGKRTVDDVLHYQRDILGFKTEFIDTFGDSKVKMRLEVPTFKTYFEAGEVLFNQLRDVIDERSSIDATRRKIIFNNTAAHVFHMIAPWITSISCLNENGEVDFSAELPGKGSTDEDRTAYTETVIDIFDTATQDDQQNGFNSFAKFVANSRITWIGTYALECPRCKAKPDLGLSSQFYPLEVQTIFFGQLYRLLPEALTRQEEGR